MSFIAPQKPASLLGRHRLLSPTAAVRVSPLALGGMNFGNAWKDSLGECSKEMSFKILDYFYKQGGNWLDTAINYQAGESEQWIGEWMEQRDIRDEMVVATKFTGMQITDREKEGGTRIKSNYSGNSAKNIHISLERSLKQLRTTYVDIVSGDLLHSKPYLTSIAVLHSHLGLISVDSRVDARSQRPLHLSKGHISWRQRYSGVDRRQGKLLCAPARPPAIRGVSRALVSSRPLFRARDHTHGTL